MSKEYWHCLIGPIERSKLPMGFDYPPRRAALNAICNGLEFTQEEIDQITCSSGWGISETKKEEIFNVLTKE